MVDVISELQTALETDGLHAVPAFYLPNLPQLAEPMVAIYPTEASQNAAFLDDFLFTDADGTAHFGRHAVYAVQLECYFPFNGSGAECPAYLDRVRTAVLTKLPTLKARQVQIDAVYYDPRSDCFRCPITVRFQLVQETG